jgi:Tfp pilus assembly protein PilV
MTIYRKIKTLTKTAKSGQSILEIIIAVAIFTLSMSSVVVLYLGVFKTNLKNNERLRADLYLQEGLEAMRSIRDYNYSQLVNTTTGGLSRTSGYWLLTGSPETLGQFTRTIRVEDVQRNSSCNIVASGGTVDSNSKKVTVTITWDYDGVPGTTSAIEYLNNWKVQNGCGQASYLVINVSAAVLAGSNKRLEGITLQNLSSSAITIDKILPTWNNSRQIEGVTINGTSAWIYNGVGTPDGRQSSGVELDLQNISIAAGTTVPLTNFTFNNSMGGADFTFVFTMSDGTTRYTEKAF